MDSFEQYKPKDMKKTISFLFIALVSCNVLAIFMNLTVSSTLGSTCSAYVATRNDDTVQTSSDFTHKKLMLFVADNSVPKLLNPLWRIPATTVVDANGATTYVQGDTVLNSEDDQYNIAGPKVTERYVAKLQSVRISEMKFPITLNWTQIEGFDVHRILLCHLGLAAFVCILSAVIVAMSFKGFEFLQNYVLWAAVATIWFSTAVHRAAASMEHPPTSSDMAQIPASEMSNVLKPCLHAGEAAYYMNALLVFMLMQVPIVVAMVPTGKSIARDVNEASGAKDSMYIHSNR